MNHWSAGTPVLPLHAAASEDVFFGSLSAEQPLGDNFYGLHLYCLISSFQDLWSNTWDNKLRSVQPCFLVWQLLSFIRKEEIMHKCLRVTPYHIPLLQGVPTSASTQCSSVPLTILRVWKECLCSDKSQMLSLSRNVPWHPVMSDMDLFMLSGWSCVLNWHSTDLLFESFHIVLCHATWELE
jgi:hypothetical protein